MHVRKAIASDDFWDSVVFVLIVVGIPVGACAIKYFPWEALTMFTAAIIVGGIVAIVFIVTVGVLIADGKLSMSGRKLKGIEPGISDEAFQAQQKVHVAKAKAQEEFYSTLGDRMTLARSKDEHYNLPPIDEALVKLIFGKDPGVVKAEIEGPKHQGR